MSFSLTFHTLAEKLPNHGEQIAYFYNCRYYPTLELHFGDFGYVWHRMEVLDNGKMIVSQGSTAEYNEGQKWDDNFIFINKESSDDSIWKLGYQIDSETGQFSWYPDEVITDDIFWIKYEELDNTVPSF